MSSRRHEAQAQKVLADSGSAEAQFNYAVCLENGRGVAVDLKEAAKYYKMAADQGHASGQVNYGVCLKNGKGVAVDLKEAAKYYKMAANQGDADGKVAYDRVIKKVAATQTKLPVARDPSAVIGTLKGFVKVKTLGSAVSLWRNESSKQQVAVKKFPRIANSEEGFKLEANILYRLDYPLILRLEFVCLPEGKDGPRIVTEYLGDESMETILATSPPWWTPTRKAITIAGLVSGMIYIHSCEVIHRDLKPSNILFDDDHRVRIADFGSSRLYELDITMTRSVGTPLYMAPECFIGRSPKYTPKVDVFSFGLILYEVVVGRGVLSTPEGARAAYSLLQADRRPEIPSSVSGEVRDLITQCWSDDAESRPSFEEILEILKSLKFEIVEGVDTSEVRSFVRNTEKRAQQV
jgi:serine/threonine protein kinase